MLTDASSRPKTALSGGCAKMLLRRIVRSLAVSLFVSAATIPGLPPVPAAGADNPIVVENAQPGSSAWLTGSLISDDAVGQIKGFGSANSVRQGDSITFYITVNPAQTYTIDVFRVGWYGGLGGRLQRHAGPLDGAPQSACDSDPNTGLIACNWAPSYTLQIPGDWTSGLYLALLTNSLGYQNYMMFVVRDERPADLLWQQSVTTEQAYNNYPADGRTGKSLYPTNTDTHANGAELRNHRGVLIPWSQYWSKEMFDAAESARDAGVNLAFLAADVASWQIRLESSRTGVANRVMVLYRDASI